MLPRTTLEILVENPPQPRALIATILKIQRPRDEKPRAMKPANYRAVVRDYGLEKYSGITADDLAAMGFTWSHRRDLEYLDAARQELGLCTLRQLYACRRHEGVESGDYNAVVARAICVEHAEARGYVRSSQRPARQIIRIQR